MTTYSSYINSHKNQIDINNLLNLKSLNCVLDIYDDSH